MCLINLCYDNLLPFFTAPADSQTLAKDTQCSHHVSFLAILLFLRPLQPRPPPPSLRLRDPSPRRLGLSTRFPPQNATNLPVKTLAEKVADAAHLHKQFPVSSGNQHRVKELEWVPVEKTEPAPAPKAARAAATKSRAAPPKEGGTTSPLALMPPPPPLPSTDTFSPLPTVATPPVFQMEEVPLPVSSAVISSTVMEPPDTALVGSPQLLSCPV